MIIIHDYLAIDSQCIYYYYYYFSMYLLYRYYYLYCHLRRMMEALGQHWRAWKLNVDWVCVHKSRSAKLIWLRTRRITAAPQNITARTKLIWVRTKTITATPQKMTIPTAAPQSKRIVIIVLLYHSIIMVIIIIIVINIISCIISCNIIRSDC